MDYVYQFLNLFEKFKELSFVSWICVLLVGTATAYGNLIGFNDGNNTAINFIIFLVISDFITRIIAQLILANKTFTKKEKEFSLFKYIRLVIYAHKIKAISSHKFFKGFFIKVISYTILLAIAQFASCVTDIELIASISSVIYGGLILYDIISILENLTDCGFTQASGLLKVFKKKANDFDGTVQDVVSDAVSTITSEITDEITNSTDNETDTLTSK